MCAAEAGSEVSVLAAASPSLKTGNKRSDAAAAATPLGAWAALANGLPFPASRRSVPGLWVAAAAAAAARDHASSVQLAPPAPATAVVLIPHATVTERLAIKQMKVAALAASIGRKAPPLCEAVNVAISAPQNDAVVTTKAALTCRVDDT
jgi:hypothetical protein